MRRLALPTIEISQSQTVHSHFKLSSSNRRSEIDMYGKSVSNVAAGAADASRAMLLSLAN
jgi:hypothetical protein